MLLLDGEVLNISFFTIYYIISNNKLADMIVSRSLILMAFVTHLSHDTHMLQREKEC